MKPHRIILAVIVIFGLAVHFTPSFAKQAPKKGSDKSIAIKIKAPADVTKKAKIQPFKMELFQKNDKLYLKLPIAAKGVWVDQRKKGVKSIGKGTSIEVTPYLSRAKAGKLTFVVLDASGKLHTKKLPVSKYLSLLKPDKTKSNKKKKSPKKVQEQSQRSIRQVSPQPLAKQLPKTLISKPDLAIADLNYVDSARLKKVSVKKASKPYISFIVKNVGKVKIDRGAFNKIPLTIKIGGRPDPSYKKLSQVVKYHHIKDPGSLHRCEIPKQLDKRTRVEFELNRNGAVEELSRDNNRVSMLLGGPVLLKSETIKGKGLTKEKATKKLTIVKPSTLSGKKVQKSSESVKATKIGENIIIAKKDKDLSIKSGLMKKSAKVNLPEGHVPEAEPLFLDLGGIRITSPRNTHVWHAGTAVTVKYRFTEDASSGPSSGQVFFTLLNRDINRVVAEKTHQYRPSLDEVNDNLAVSTSSDNSFIWNLPGNLLRGSDYVVMARGESLWGMSDTFAIHPLPDGDLGGIANGIEILDPSGGEIFRPGGTMTVRYRLIDPDMQTPSHIDIKLLYSDFTEPISRLVLESGNASLPETDIVFRIPDDLSDQVNGYIVSVVGRGVEGPDPGGSSRAFTITSATSFGDAQGTYIPESAQLVALSPGIGGEHWALGSTHTILWRFHSGGATIPGTWLVTLLKYNPSIGYRIDRSFTIDSYEVREVQQGGLTWLEHSANWIVPEDMEMGDYKVRISGHTYSDDGPLNFTIGDQDDWNFKPVSLKLGTDDTSLFVGLADIPATGRNDFLVEVLSADSRSVLHSQEVQALIAPLSGDPTAVPTPGVVMVKLGTAKSLAGGDLSGFDCGIHFRVTADITNRVDETNEIDNQFDGWVIPGGERQLITVLNTEDRVLQDGLTIRCSSEYNFHHTIFKIVVKNCTSRSFNVDRIRVEQSGEWRDPETGNSLNAYTEPRWHDPTLVYQTRLGEIRSFTQVTIPIIKRYFGNIRLVDSNLFVHFEGNLAGLVPSNPFGLILLVGE